MESIDQRVATGNPSGTLSLSALLDLLDSLDARVKWQTHSAFVSRGRVGSAGMEVVDLSEMFAGAPDGTWWPLDEFMSGYLPKVGWGGGE